MCVELLMKLERSVQQLLLQFMVCEHIMTQSAHNQHTYIYGHKNHHHLFPLVPSSVPPIIEAASPEVRINISEPAVLASLLGTHAQALHGRRMMKSSPQTLQESTSLISKLEL